MPPFFYITWLHTLRTDLVCQWTLIQTHRGCSPKGAGKGSFRKSMLGVWEQAGGCLLPLFENPFLALFFRIWVLPHVICHHYCLLTGFPDWHHFSNLIGVVKYATKLSLKGTIAFFFFLFKKGTECWKPTSMLSGEAVLPVSMMLQMWLLGALWIARSWFLTLDCSYKNRWSKWTEGNQGIFPT